MHFLHFFLFQYESVLSFNYNSNINLFSFLISVVSFLFLLLFIFFLFIEWKLRKNIFTLQRLPRTWLIHTKECWFLLLSLTYSFYTSYTSSYIYFTYVVYYCKSICIDWNERNVLLCNFQSGRNIWFLWIHIRMLCWNVFIVSFVKNNNSISSYAATVTWYVAGTLWII